MSKLKIGDRVKIIKRFSENSSGNGTGKNLGDIGIITEIGSSSTAFHPRRFISNALYSIWMEKYPSKRRYLGMFIAEELELILSESSQNKHMRKFKLGNRVECIEEYGWVKVGMKGTMVSLPYGVKWDNSESEGHNCSGVIESGRGGYFMEEYNIRLIKWEINMNKLTAKIKRIFNSNLQAQYRAGFIDDCGDLTALGVEEQAELVRVEFDERLTERAEERIAEEKKENK